MTQTIKHNDDIYQLHWPTEGETKGIILLVHGLGEHCERYARLAEFVNNAGYAMCSIDLPGHGQSAGKRGHIDRFADFETAVLGLYENMNGLYPESDVFLLGHSMGGLIATHLLLQHQHLFKGAMLSGPAIQSPQTPSAVQLKIISIVGKILPRLGMLKLDASQVSRDPAVVEDYMNDPLVSKSKLSARLLTEMFSSMQDCVEQAAAIRLPMLIMHGGADVMTAPEGAQLLYDSISSSDKTLKIYPGLYHEIFNEPEQLEIYAEMVAWLDAHRTTKSVAA
ncbi:MAG: alpha/beta hydrolase [Gammaproteobacteria bacterium]|nr:alpha/beta hydrolase [Gammaproteobacteria bacterium]